MLKFLSCACSSAEPLLRGLLQEANFADWLYVPLHKGREHCLSVLDGFPAPFQALLAFQALVKFIEEHSSYAIVLGYDDTTFYWVDISRNAPKEKAEARAVLERFA